MFKNLLLGIVASLFMISSAMADYTLIVPQAPGKGTSVWAGIIAKNLSKFLDEPVVIRHIPGARISLVTTSSTTNFVSMTRQSWLPTAVMVCRTY